MKYGCLLNVLLFPSLAMHRAVSGNLYRNTCTCSKRQTHYDTQDKLLKGAIISTTMKTPGTEKRDLESHILRNDSGFLLQCDDIKAAKMKTKVFNYVFERERRKAA